MTDAEEVLVQASRWLSDSQPIALAAVVETWSASPRPPGSLLVATADGRFAGSVSGGCVEAAVVAAAGTVTTTGAPKLLSLFVDDEDARAAGLVCGGALSVLVGPVSDPSLPGRVLGRRPSALVRSASTDAWTLVTMDGVEGSLNLEQAELERVRAALASGESTRLDDRTHGTCYVTVFDLPLRLLLIGGVHIAQLLTRLATIAGIEVAIIDPRTAFASPDRFPGVTLSNDWPDEAIAVLAPDSRTAIVTLAHDPKLDDPALIAGLSSRAFYVGALGSTRSHALRRERLLDAGVAVADLKRIHAPVGLDLGGRKPAEIAVAILAQVVAARYGRPTHRQGAR